jgi:hypothetical protein
LQPLAGNYTALNWKIRKSSLAFQKLFAGILKTLRWNFKANEDFLKS